MIPQCHRPPVVRGSSVSYCEETLTAIQPVSRSMALYNEKTLTTPPQVSGSMASYCKEALTISPPVSGSKALHCEGTLTTSIVPATQVEDKWIRQELLKFKLKRSRQNKE